ncbi:MAG: hypothetical protein ISS91_03320 [Candidatus Omnitrophica bacterium]|nr:hypothetical protein [Candidatus Omnitrophota bacterium]
MAENISPEERLFKVIQEGSQEKPDDAPEKRPGAGIDGWIRGIKRSILSARAGRPGRPGKGFDWKKIIPRAAGAYEVKPELLNKVLAVILVFVTALVAYSAFGRRQNTVKIAETISRLKKSALTGAREAAEPFKKVEFYLDALRKRDIFHPVPKGAAPEPGTASKESLKNAAANLKLQGISWGDKPTVMILLQTEKESKMYFLIQGQPIGATGIKVKYIYRDRVVIERGGSEMELL